MGLTELKQKHSERMISLVTTDIVIAGLRELARVYANKELDNPLAEDFKKCLDDINGSTWDEIRSIIKRSL